VTDNRRRAKENLQPLVRINADAGCSGWAEPGLVDTDAVVGHGQQSRTFVRLFSLVSA
jgi:hypothetical protein